MKIERKRLLQKLLKQYKNERILKQGVTITPADSKQLLRLIQSSKDHLDNAQSLIKQQSAANYKGQVDIRSIDFQLKQANETIVQAGKNLKKIR